MFVSFVFFFKQKTAYEMRISDWSSDVCSSDLHNWSVYAQAGYDLTDRLDLTVSGRYMRESNQADFLQPVESDSHSVEKKFVPSATLSYDIDDGNAYVRWARGFTTGGVNIMTAPINYPKTSDGSILGPDPVDSKSEEGSIGKESVRTFRS